MAYGSQPRWTGQSAATQLDVDVGLRDYMLRIYNYMASGLALTGIVAYVAAMGGRDSFIAHIYHTPVMWLVILAPLGLVFAFHWTGAALAAAVMAFPLMVRPIRLSIEAIDKEVLESALTLGAPALVRFARITVPLAGPGLAAGAVVGFAKALGEFGATITFVGAIPGATLTLPSAIYIATQSPGGEARTLALCGVAAILAVVAVLISDRLGQAAARWAGRP